jgi:hypothetical protein
MDRINEIILEAKIKDLKIKLEGCFDAEPHLYKALALQSMGFNEHTIVHLLRIDLRDFKESHHLLLKEMIERQNKQLEQLRLAEQESQKYEIFVVRKDSFDDK